MIAGESRGVHSIIDTKTPIISLHLTLEPSTKATQPVPEGYNSFAYIIEGKGLFGIYEKPAETQQLVFFANEGNGISINVPDNVT